MRKREFLRRLGQELSHLDRDERNDILDYYDELIEDRIEKTGNSESDVIYDLGEIEDIARRVDPTHRRKFKYEEEEELPRKKSRRRRSSKSIIGIILSICLIPLWIVIFAPSHLKSFPPLPCSKQGRGVPPPFSQAPQNYNTFHRRSPSSHPWQSR